MMSLSIISIKGFEINWNWGKIFIFLGDHIEDILNLSIFLSCLFIYLSLNRLVKIILNYDNSKEEIARKWIRILKGVFWIFAGFIGILIIYYDYIDPNNFPLDFPRFDCKRILKFHLAFLLNGISIYINIKTYGIKSWRTWLSFLSLFLTFFILTLYLSTSFNEKFRKTVLDLATTCASIILLLWSVLSEDGFKGILSLPIRKLFPWEFLEKKGYKLWTPTEYYSESSPAKLINFAGDDSTPSQGDGVESKENSSMSNTSEKDPVLESSEEGINSLRGQYSLDNIENSNLKAKDKYSKWIIKNKGEKVGYSAGSLRNFKNISRPNWGYPSYSGRAYINIPNEVEGEFPLRKESCRPILRQRSISWPGADWSKSRDLNFENNRTIPPTGGYSLKSSSRDWGKTEFDKNINESSPFRRNGDGSESYPNYQYSSDFNINKNKSIISYEPNPWNVRMEIIHQVLSKRNPSPIFQKIYEKKIPEEYRIAWKKEGKSIKDNDTGFRLSWGNQPGIRVGSSKTLLHLGQGNIEKDLLVSDKKSGELNKSPSSLCEGVNKSVFEKEISWFRPKYSFVSTSIEPSPANLIKFAGGDASPSPTQKVGDGLRNRKSFYLYESIENIIGKELKKDSIGIMLEENEEKENNLIGSSPSQRDGSESEVPGPIVTGSINKSNFIPISILKESSEYYDNISIQNKGKGKLTVKFDPKIYFLGENLYKDIEDIKLEEEVNIVSSKIKLLEKTIKESTIEVPIVPSDLVISKSGKKKSMSKKYVKGMRLPQMTPPPNYPIPPTPNSLIPSIPNSPIPPTPNNSISPAPNYPIPPTPKNPIVSLLSKRDKLSPASLAGDGKSGTNQRPFPLQGNGKDKFVSELGKSKKTIGLMLPPAAPPPSYPIPEVPSLVSSIDYKLKKVPEISSGISEHKGKGKVGIKERSGRLTLTEKLERVTAQPTLVKGNKNLISKSLIKSMPTSKFFMKSIIFSDDTIDTSNNDAPLLEEELQEKWLDNMKSKKLEQGLLNKPKKTREESINIFFPILEDKFKLSEGIEVRKPELDPILAKNLSEDRDQALDRVNIWWQEEMDKIRNEIEKEYLEVLYEPLDRFNFKWWKGDPSLYSENEVVVKAPIDIRLLDIEHKWNKYKDKDKLNKEDINKKKVRWRNNKSQLNENKNIKKAEFVPSNNVNKSIESSIKLSDKNNKVYGLLKKMLKNENLSNFVNREDKLKGNAVVNEIKKDSSFLIKFIDKMKEEVSLKLKTRSKGDINIKKESLLLAEKLNPETKLKLDSNEDKELKGRVKGLIGLIKNPIEFVPKLSPSQRDGINKDIKKKPEDNSEYFILTSSTPPPIVPHINLGNEMNPVMNDNLISSDNNLVTKREGVNEIINDLRSELEDNNIRESDNRGKIDILALNKEWSDRINESELIRNRLYKEYKNKRINEKKIISKDNNILGILKKKSESNMELSIYRIKRWLQETMAVNRFGIFKEVNVSPYWIEKIPRFDNMINKKLQVEQIKSLPPLEPSLIRFYTGKIWEGEKDFHEDKLMRLQKIVNRLLEKENRILNEKSEKVNKIYDLFREKKNCLIKMSYERLGIPLSNKGLGYVPYYPTSITIEDIDKEINDLLKTLPLISNKENLKYVYFDPNSLQKEYHKMKELNNISNITPNLNEVDKPLVYSNDVFIRDKINKNIIDTSNKGYINVEKDNNKFNIMENKPDIDADLYSSLAKFARDDSNGNNLFSRVIESLDINSIEEFHWDFYKWGIELEDVFIKMPIELGASSTKSVIKLENKNNLPSIYKYEELEPSYLQKVRNYYEYYNWAKSEDPDNIEEIIDNYIYLENHEEDLDINVQLETYLDKGGNLEEFFLEYRDEESKMKLENLLGEEQEWIIESLSPSLWDGDKDLIAANIAAVESDKIKGKRSIEFNTFEDGDKDSNIIIEEYLGEEYNILEGKSDLILKELKKKIKENEYCISYKEFPKSSENLEVTFLDLNKKEWTRLIKLIMTNSKLIVNEMGEEYNVYSKFKKLPKHKKIDITETKVEEIEPKQMNFGDKDLKHIDNENNKSREIEKSQLEESKVKKEIINKGKEKLNLSNSILNLNISKVRSHILGIFSEDRFHPSGKGLINDELSDTKIVEEDLKGEVSSFKEKEMREKKEMKEKLIELKSNPVVLSELLNIDSNYNDLKLKRDENTLSVVEMPKEVISSVKEIDILENLSKLIPIDRKELDSNIQDIIIEDSSPANIAGDESSRRMYSESYEKGVIESNKERRDITKGRVEELIEEHRVGGWWSTMKSTITDIREGPSTLKMDSPYYNRGMIPEAFPENIEEKYKKWKPVYPSIPSDSMKLKVKYPSSPLPVLKEKSSSNLRDRDGKSSVINATVKVIEDKSKFNVPIISIKDHKEQMEYSKSKSSILREDTIVPVSLINTEVALKEEDKLGKKKNASTLSEYNPYSQTKSHSSSPYQRSLLIQSQNSSFVQSKSHLSIPYSQQGIPRLKQQPQFISTNEPIRTSYPNATPMYVDQEMRVPFNKPRTFRAFYPYMEMDPKGYDKYNYLGYPWKIQGPLEGWITSLKIRAQSQNSMPIIWGDFTGIPNKIRINARIPKLPEEKLSKYTSPEDWPSRVFDSNASDLNNKARKVLGSKWRYHPVEVNLPSDFKLEGKMKRWKLQIKNQDNPYFKGTKIWGLTEEEQEWEKERSRVRTIKYWNDYNDPRHQRYLSGSKYEREEQQINNERARNPIPVEYEYITDSSYDEDGNVIPKGRERWKKKIEKMEKKYKPITTVDFIRNRHSSSGWNGKWGNPKDVGHAIGKFETSWVRPKSNRKIYINKLIESDKNHNINWVKAVYTALSYIDSDLIKHPYLELKTHFESMEKRNELWKDFERKRMLYEAKREDKIREFLHFDYIQPKHIFNTKLDVTPLTTEEWSKLGKIIQNKELLFEYNQYIRKTKIWWEKEVKNRPMAFWEKEYNVDPHGDLYRELKEIKDRLNLLMNNHLIIGKRIIEPNPLIKSNLKDEQLLVKIESKYWEELSKNNLIIREKKEKMPPYPFEIGDKEILKSLENSLVENEILEGLKDSKHLYKFNRDGLVYIRGWKNTRDLSSDLESYRSILNESEDKQVILSSLNVDESLKKKKNKKVTFKLEPEILSNKPEKKEYLHKGINLKKGIDNIIKKFVNWNSSNSKSTEKNIQLETSNSNNNKVSNKLEILNNLSMNVASDNIKKIVQPSPSLLSIIKTPITPIPEEEVFIGDDVNKSSPASLAGDDLSNNNNKMLGSLDIQDPVPFIETEYSKPENRMIKYEDNINIHGEEIQSSSLIDINTFKEDERVSEKEEGTLEVISNNDQKNVVRKGKDDFGWTRGSRITGSPGKPWVLEKEKKKEIKDVIRHTVPIHWEFGNLLFPPEEFEYSLSNIRESVIQKAADKGLTWQEYEEEKDPWTFSKLVDRTESWPPENPWKRPEETGNMNLDKIQHERWVIRNLSALPLTDPMWPKFGGVMGMKDDKVYKIIPGKVETYPEHITYVQTPYEKLWEDIHETRRLHFERLDFIEYTKRIRPPTPEIEAIPADRNTIDNAAIYVLGKIKTELKFRLKREKLILSRLKEPYIIELIEREKRYVPLLQRTKENYIKYKKMREKIEQEISMIGGMNRNITSESITQWINEYLNIKNLYKQRNIVKGIIEYLYNLPGPHSPHIIKDKEIVSDWATPFCPLLGNQAERWSNLDKLEWNLKWSKVNLKKNILLSHFDLIMSEEEKFVEGIRPTGIGEMDPGTKRAFKFLEKVIKDEIEWKKEILIEKWKVRNEEKYKIGQENFFVKKGKEREATQSLVLNRIDIWNKESGVFYENPKDIFIPFRNKDINIIKSKDNEGIIYVKNILVNPIKENNEINLSLFNTVSEEITDSLKSKLRSLRVPQGEIYDLSILWKKEYLEKMRVQKQGIQEEEKNTNYPYIHKDIMDWFEMRKNKIFENMMEWEKEMEEHRKILPLRDLYIKGKNKIDLTLNADSLIIDRLWVKLIKEKFDYIMRGNVPVGYGLPLDQAEWKLERDQFIKYLEYKYPRSVFDLLIEEDDWTFERDQIILEPLIKNYQIEQKKNIERIVRKIKGFIEEEKELFWYKYYVQDEKVRFRNLEKWEVLKDVIEMSDEEGNTVKQQQNYTDSEDGVLTPGSEFLSEDDVSDIEEAVKWAKENYSYYSNDKNLKPIKRYNEEIMRVKEINRKYARMDSSDSEGDISSGYDSDYSSGDEEEKT